MSLNQALKIKFVLVSVSVAHELEFSPDTTIGAVKAEIIKNFAIGSGVVKIRGPNGMHIPVRLRNISVTMHLNRLICRL